MKITFFFIVLAIGSTLNLCAQDRSPFRTGYLKLGTNKLGNKLDYSLTPKENIFDGRYGAGAGYVLEFGHIYYFKNRKNGSLMNYGLDWTILSLNYNKMDKWESYAIASGDSEAYVDGSMTAAAISTKLGPNISFNPIEKLVIDVRLQFAPTIRFFDFEYSESEMSPDGRYFYFINEEGSSTDEDYDSESIKNRLAYGVATSFGITLRRKAIGLSFDYISGKVKSNFEAYDAQTGNTFGKEKIKANNLQFKLSFTL